MKIKNLIWITAGTLLILLVPLVSMLFTDEVQWNLFDFLVIGTLLMSAGVAYEFVRSKVSEKHRVIVALVVVAAVLLIWAELAVGIFGSPIAGS